MGYIIALLFSAGSLNAGEPPLRIVATIKPLQLIAAAVIGDTQAVDLLLDPRMSPHDYQLRPSDRNKLERADLVLWIGPTLETFLTPILASLPKHVKVISLQTEIGITGDPHLWMDPLLAAAMGQQIAHKLGELAPAHQALWQANADRLEKQLIAEDGRLREQITKLSTPRGYLVAHDAYGRFEARYGLHHKEALTDIADLPPSAQHLARIEKLLNDGEISCVMQEPAVPPRVLRALLKDRDLHIETIDALALNVPLQDDGIVMFYQAVGAKMMKCLQR